MKDPLEEATETVTRRGATGAALILLLGLVVLGIARPSTVDTLLIILGIAALIMVHEAGHYLAAKRAGMKVTEFFLGFGPRIWSVRRGETEYGVKVLPLGGYVRIIGMNNIEEVDPADESRTYRQGSFGQRLTVVLAGVTVNIVVAALLFFVVFAARGLPDGPSTTISEVVAGTPASRDGLEPGDRIVEIDGHRIDDWQDVPDALENQAGEVTTFVVERDGRVEQLEIRPEQRSATDSSGFVGISPEDSYRSLGLVGAARESVATMGRGTAGLANGLADLFSPSGLSRYSENFTDEPSGSGSGSGGGGARVVEEDRPRGIVGIVDLGGELVDGDMWKLLYLLAGLNLIVALFNLIPLLPFDGGHAAIACYEQVVSKVRRKEVRVDYRRLVPVTAVVLALFLTLGLSVMYLDLRDIINGS
ncbi:MAG TPA: M50 family metallopeptidase [Acidimicrobiia bacterium]|nr:M50 family metallopeptidase [Acidimicrobiia bacterium]